jgi:hypothetical protein
MASVVPIGQDFPIIVGPSGRNIELIELLTCLVSPVSVSYSWHTPEDNTGYMPSGWEVNDDINVSGWRHSKYLSGLPASRPDTIGRIHTQTVGLTVFEVV